MPRSVFLCRRLRDLGAHVVDLGHRLTDSRADADLIVTADPGLSVPPGSEVLQFGGPVIDTLPGGRYITAPTTADAWRVTPAADMLGLSALASATLLVDPPTTALRWAGETQPPEPAHATPLVTAGDGQHAAAIIHRSDGGTLWWVSDHTLDTRPWLDAILHEPLRPTLSGYDLE